MEIRHPLLDFYDEGVEIHTKGADEYVWIARSAMATLTYEPCGGGSRVVIGVASGQTYVLQYAEEVPYIYKALVRGVWDFGSRGPVATTFRARGMNISGP
jgi:hypothetical protein